MTGRLCGRGLGGGGTQHDASLASVFASTSSADAWLEIVLDRFSHVSHGRVVGTTEHFARVSSRIEPARLLRFTRTCGILDFPVFEKKIRVPFDFVSLFHTADKIERNCHAALSF